MIQSVNLPPSAHPVYTLQQSLHLKCTLQLYYPVHTAAILSSAHYSYTIQCTLQLFYLVHTAAILSSAHCSYTIQCTLQLHYLVPILYSTSSALPQGKPITLLAYLQSSQQTLMVDCSSPYDEEDWLFIAVH